MPFTRCLAGAFDFTPVFYKKNRTHAHMAAMLLVYPGASAVVRSGAKKFTEEDPSCAGVERNFIKALPMTYDETVPLEAEIGDHVTIARRKDDRWYVAGICGERGRSARIDLGFLGDGNWQVSLYRDGELVADDWTPVVRQELRVTKSDVLTVDESPCGGFTLVADPVPGCLPPMRRGDVNYRPLRVFDDAAWIWTPDAENALFFRFRNEFATDGSPITLHVSADERYVLLLDGEEVSRGPARGIPSQWFCQKVSIAPRLGRHRLEAIVWTLGEDAPMAQMSSGGGFFLKAEGAFDERLTTGKGVWHVSSLRNTMTDGRTCAESFGCGTQFKVVGTSFLEEDPPAANWKPAIVVSVPLNSEHVDRWGIVPKGRCVYESSLPEMMLRPMKPGEIPQEPIRVQAQTRRTWLFDLGDYYCAYPVLTVSGGKGSKIRFGFAECLMDEAGKKLHRVALDDR